MLRDWSYEMSADPLESEETASHPEFTDVSLFPAKVERNTENDLIDLEDIADDVIFKLSQELKQKKLSRRQRNDKRIEVIYDDSLFFWQQIKMVNFYDQRNYSFRFIINFIARRLYFMNGVIIKFIARRLSYSFWFDVFVLFINFNLHFI